MGGDEVKTNRDGAATLVLGMLAHTGRSEAVGELHARPFPLVASPAVIIELAFMTGESAEADRDALAAVSRLGGVAPPQAGARIHVAPMAGGTLRWESHAEFSTWRWEGPASSGRGFTPFSTLSPPPGAVIAGVRVDIANWTRGAQKLVAAFDQASLCHSTVDDGAAAIVTDFRQDSDGLTRILILDKAMSPARLGALSQRLIEIEVYRTLALLTLPIARRLSASTGAMENELAEITGEMQKNGRNSAALLDRLTTLAARLEGETAASLYRFGAARAYHEIVEQRLASIREEPVSGYGGWWSFLKRRLNPAMRTCRSVEERQESLSRKLARTTTLLRSWVEVDLQNQNRELLASMNKRADLQLRLQQTVEGLSVAAVSYYVVGLIGYAFKGAEKILPVSVAVATAFSVPLVLAAVWWMVRRIRRHHSEPL
ncbi:MAG: DUF3422 domain-containing protein [Phyllobacteriaceae bacterium]|nr:DUF3422 domain-containing protein [Phyllobacteriaceae bacterium]